VFSDAVQLAASLGGVVTRTVAAKTRRDRNMPLARADESVA
jgi:hypothetical protein